MEEVVNLPLHHTLDEVNEVARDRLYDLFQKATPEEIPPLVDSLAKLNTSMRNNNQFTEPASDEELAAKHQQDIIAQAVSGDTIDD